MKTYYYFTNLNERGEYYADIRNEAGDTLIEIDTEYAQFLKDEDVNVSNLLQVWRYFRDLGDFEKNSELVKGNSAR